MSDLVDLSYRTHVLKLSHRVPGYSQVVMDSIPRFRDALRQEQERIAEGGREYLHPNERMLDYDLLQMIETVVEGDYQPRATGELQGIVSRKMGVNSITALNANLQPLLGRVKALIIGAGFGQDIRRIREAAINADEIDFTCIEPDAYRAKQMQFENPNVRVHPKKFLQCADEVYADGPYDVIVCTLSLQHIVGRCRDPVEGFNRYLTSRGVLIGSYFDHDSFFSLYNAVLEETCGNMSVGEIEPDRDRENPAVIGVRTTSIFGKVFHDPIVTPELIHNFSVRHNLQPQIFRGKAIYQIYPDAARSIPKISEIKGSRVTSLVTVCVFRRLVDVGYPRLCQAEGKALPLPKGKHLAKGDLIHFRANTFMAAFKLDGVGCVLTIDKRGLLDGDVVLHSDMPQFKNVIYLHCEKVGEKYYILDILPQSFTYPRMPFLFRYTMAMLISSMAVYSGYINLDYNEHFPMRSALDFAKFVDMGGLARVATDGIVLVPHAGVEYGGYTATRYLKRERTVDVQGPDGIEERYVVAGAIGEIKRMRPDKSEPNPADIVQLIKDAPEYREATEFLMMQFDLKLAALDMDALNIDSTQIPTAGLVPDDMWTRLFIGRSAIPSEHAEIISQWMRVHGAAVIERYDAEIRKALATPVQPDLLSSEGYDA